MTLLLRWFFATVAILVASWFLPGFVVSGTYIALIVALILGIINITIRPIIFLFTLPLNIFTFGLFSFVINALLLWFVSTFVRGFSIQGFWWALLGALVISAINHLGNLLIHELKKPERTNG
jgi:putative membrane protein